MAPTYDPQDALNALTAQLGAVTLDATAKGIVCDNAHKFLWNIYPWRWERKVLPNITLVDGQQDYTGSNVPTDFHQLIRAQIQRTDSTPNTIWELDVKHYVYEDPGSKNFPCRDIAFIQELNSGAGGFRLGPTPSIGTGVTAVVNGTYRKTPTTKYTSANLTTDFAELPDQYFHVFVEVLFYHILRFVGDPRAGAINYDRKRRQAVYNGQLGVAMDAIAVMAEMEDLPDVETIVPLEPLGYFGRMTGRSLLP